MITPGGRVGVVTVDAPPAPQYRTVDHRYVAYERDSFAQATAKAHEQIGRRYGDKAVTILEAVEGLTKQYLAGGQ